MEMQVLAASIRPRCFCLSSTRSLAGSRAMAESSFFLPASAFPSTFKLPSLVPCRLPLLLLASPRATWPPRCVAAPLDNAALFEESSIPVIDPTKSVPDKEAVFAESSIPVKFILNKRCKFGQRFSIVGSDPLFGSWDPLAGVPMKWSEGHIWTAELDVPLGKEIEFKFVLTGKAVVIWQPGQNHIFKAVGSVLPLIVSEEWETTLSEGSLEEKVEKAEVTKPEGFLEERVPEAEAKVEGFLEEKVPETEGKPEGFLREEPLVEVSKPEGFLETRVLEAEAMKPQGLTKEQVPDTELRVGVTKPEDFLEESVLDTGVMKPQALMEERVPEAEVTKAEGLMEERAPEAELTSSEVLLEGLSEAELPVEVIKPEGFLEESVQEAVKPQGLMEEQVPEAKVIRSDGLMEQRVLEAEVTSSEALLKERIPGATQLTMNEERVPEAESINSEGILKGRIPGATQSTINEEKVLELVEPSEPIHEVDAPKHAGSLTSGISDSVNDGEKNGEVHKEFIGGNGRFPLSDSTTAASHTEVTIGEGISEE